MSRLVLGPTQPPIQWVPETVSFGGGVKQQGYEADHSLPSSAGVKNGRAIPLLPHTSYVLCLIKSKNNNYLSLNFEIIHISYCYLNLSSSIEFLYSVHHFLILLCCSFMHIVKFFLMFLYNLQHIKLSKNSFIFAIILYLIS
jgi:hypothetical protein